MDLNRTPVEIGYNGHIRVLYLTMNELSFMQECQRFDSRWRQKEIFFHTSWIYYTFYIFISIKLDKIKPSLKKLLFQNGHGQDLNHDTSCLCPVPLPLHHIFSCLGWKIYNYKTNIIPPPIKQMSKFSQITSKFGTNWKTPMLLSCT